MPTPAELYGQTDAPMTPEERYGPQPIVPEVAKPREETLGDRMLEEAPQTVGGIGGGLAGAAALAPLGPAGILMGGVGGAFFGGAAGKGYQNVYRALFGDEKKAPKSSYDAAVEMALAGGEEAAWDLGGQLVGRGLVKGFHYIRPKAVDDVEKIAIGLEKKGGQLTAAQRSDSWLLHQLDSLTRGSMTGSGRMKQIDVMNEAAVKTLESELRQNMAKDVAQNLSDQEMGELFLNTLKGGRAAHRVVTGEMYEGLDDLVSASVNTRTMKEGLIPLQEQLSRINWVGESPESKKLLDSMLKQTDELTFSDAQVLRSNLLDAQRNLEGTLGKSKVSSKINQVVNDLTLAMDDAALKGGEDIAAKYKAIKKYAKTGYKAFDNKFIADMIVADKKAPERIGEYLFQSGNVKQINEAKRALRYAARFNPKIKYDETWRAMKLGYLDNILSRSSRPADISAAAGVGDVTKSATDISGAKLLKEFTDSKKARTLAATFTREERSAILEFAKTAERVQRSPEGGLGMVMQLAQGGAVIGAATGRMESGEIASMFVPTWVMAKAMTSPKGARLMATALKTPNVNGRGTAVVSQLAGYLNDIQEKEEEGNQ